MISTLNEYNITDSKSGLCPQKTRSFLSHSNQEDLKISTELVEILNIQKIGNFLSLKFPRKLGGNSRWE